MLYKYITNICSAEVIDVIIPNLKSVCNALKTKVVVIIVKSIIVKQSKVYLPVGNVVCNKETLTAGEYIRLFLKCEKKQKVTIKENSKGEILELSIENEANLMPSNKEYPPVLEWNFNSLKLAIDTMFALNETSQRKTVKMCKHCGKPFASDNLKAEYCSPQCRNQANVYKSRAKNK